MVEHLTDRILYGAREAATAAVLEARDVGLSLDEMAEVVAAYRLRLHLEAELGE